MNGRRGTYTDRVEDTRAALLGDPDADERPTLGVGADDDDPIERSRRKRRNRKVLVVALVLLLVPVLAVGGYLVWLNQIVTNNVKQEQLLPDAAPPVDANGNAVPLPTGSGTNYLIIGGDAGPGRGRGHAPTSWCWPTCRPTTATSPSSTSRVTSTCRSPARARTSSTPPTPSAARRCSSRRCRTCSASRSTTSR